MLGGKFGAVRSATASVPVQDIITQSAYLGHNILILLYVTIPSMAPCSHGSSPHWEV